MHVESTVLTKHRIRFKAVKTYSKGIQMQEYESLNGNTGEVDSKTP